MQIYDPFTLVKTSILAHMYSKLTL